MKIITKEELRIVTAITCNDNNGSDNIIYNIDCENI